MFEADLLGVHETAAERVHLLFLYTYVTQVPHHAVPGFTGTAPHEKHHADWEGLEVGVDVVLAGEACFAEEVDAQCGEDEVAEHDEKCDVGEWGQDEDEGVNQQFECARFLDQADHTHHPKGADHTRGRPDVHCHLLREEWHGQDDADVSAHHHDEVEHVPRVAELLFAQRNLFYHLLHVEDKCKH